VLAPDEPDFLARAQQLAADEGIYLAMGLNTVHTGEKPPSDNKFVLIDPSGALVVSYEKSHPVPGWESSIMRVGARIVPVAATSLGRIAGAICNDASFPEFIRQAGRQQAALLIEPANDWREIAAIHFHMDGIRAIENGMPVLRPASSGITGAFDPWGRVLAQADFFADGEHSIVAQLPTGHVPTFYARFGDVFAWLCVAGLGAALLMALSSRQA
jgi:apolipoprotein N-acyltransferase